MIQGVGLGAAMPQSAPALKQAADHTIPNTLADFVRSLTEEPNKKK